MPVSTAALLTGATIAPSGGTALQFASAGSTMDKNKIYVSADTDLRTRREIELTVKYPKVQVSAPNGYTQARSLVTLKFPKTLANGLVTVNTITVNMSTDVETTVAEKLEYRKVAAQVLIDADFTAFFDSLAIE